MLDRTAGNASHLNDGETKGIMFSSDYNIDRLEDSDFPDTEVPSKSKSLLHGVFVPFLDIVINHGVVMDSKLTWEP